jgi:hypothetical protein
MLFFGANNNEKLKRKKVQPKNLVNTKSSLSETLKAVKIEKMREILIFLFRCSSLEPTIILS